MANVTFADETTSGVRRDALGLQVAEAHLVLRELLDRRAVEEATEGGHDPRGAGEQAVAAFARGRFLVLVGDRQVTDLDAPTDLSVATEITFLNLVPLVGG
ncbi:hypothetical protein ABZ070_11280 [Streptomyces sp. NPDC006283]|uniref:hypothetical protein n=1 Tax=Streptomyces sp. NPDC006283 TaxID=3156741 RepID=UPI0033A0FF2F